MAFVELESSPLAPGLSPVSIHYHRAGVGAPLLFLHGGWGYAIYPIDLAASALGDHEVLVPDRSGYGRSPRLTRFARPLHAAAAAETLSFLDALGIQRCALWGHSDGAVIAANVALISPGRVTGVVLESLHHDRRKPRSRDFFLHFDPASLDDRVAAVLAEDHGEDYWRDVLAMEGRAWAEILAEAESADGDLYGGRLSELSVPTLVIHGAEDPRTEPGELEEVRRLLPRAAFHVLEGARHAPHAEARTAEPCVRLVREFLAGLR